MLHFIIMNILHTIASVFVTCNIKYLGGRGAQALHSKVIIYIWQEE